MLSENHPSSEGQAVAGPVPTTSLKERVFGYFKLVSSSREIFRHLNACDRFRDYLDGEIALVEYMMLNGSLPKDSNQAFGVFVNEGFAELWQYFSKQDLKRLRDRAIELYQMKQAGDYKPVSHITQKSPTFLKNGVGKASRIAVFIRNLLSNLGSADRFKKYYKGEMALMLCMKKDGLLPEGNGEALQAFIEGDYPEIYECFARRDLLHLIEVVDGLIEKVA